MHLVPSSSHACMRPTCACRLAHMHPLFLRASSIPSLSLSCLLLAQSSLPLSHACRRPTCACRSAMQRVRHQFQHDFIDNDSISNFRRPTCACRLAHMHPLFLCASSLSLSCLLLAQPSLLSLTPAGGLPARAAQRHACNERGINFNMISLILIRFQISGGLPARAAQRAPCMQRARHRFQGRPARGLARAAARAAGVRDAGCH